jgi:hypothetical protein
MPKKIKLNQRNLIIFYTFSVVWYLWGKLDSSLVIKILNKLGINVSYDEIGKCVLKCLESNRFVVEKGQMKFFRTYFNDFDDIPEYLKYIIKTTAEKIYLDGGVNQCRSIGLNAQIVVKLSKKYVILPTGTK